MKLSKREPKHMGEVMSDIAERYDKLTKTNKMSKEENRNLTKTTEEILQRHAEFAQRHAIEFAEFVSNDSVFDDFWSMSKEHQENIYQEFINQNKHTKQRW